MRSAYIFGFFSPSRVRIHCRAFIFFFRLGAEAGPARALWRQTRARRPQTKMDNFEHDVIREECGCVWHSMYRAVCGLYVNDSRNRDWIDYCPSHADEKLQEMRQKARSEEERFSRRHK